MKKKLFLIFTIHYSLERYFFVIFLSVLFISFPGQGQIVRLDSGLVAYYPFNGNANDESGNGNNGTVHGATLTTDRFGNPNSAYSFNGISDYITLNSNTKLNLDTSSRTFCAWVKTSSQSIQTIFSKSQRPRPNQGYVFYYMYLNNGVDCEIVQNYTSNEYYYQWAMVNISDNQWHSIIATYQNNGLTTFYIDCKKITSYVSQGQPGNYNTDYPCSFEIGSRGDNDGYLTGAYFWNGQLDEIRVYNRILNEREIQYLSFGSPLLNNLGKDTSTCKGRNIKLDAGNSGSNYFWSTGDTTQTITVSNAGKYLVTVSFGNCSAKDSINVSFANPVAINPAFHNQSQCLDSSIAFTLNPASGTGPYSYQWMLNGTIISEATNSLYSKTKISKADSGKYSCTIANACNSVTGDIVSLTPVVCNRTHHTISGHVTYDNKSLTPLSSKFDSTITDVYLYNGGDTLIAKVQTDDNGFYEFVDIINGTYYIFGSTKKTWGGSNPTDALIVNRKYIGLYQFKDSLLWGAGDVDSNGVLNPVDALIINRRYIGLLTKYPKEKDWKFQKIKVEMQGENLTQNLKAVCSGDVNASYVPPARVMSYELGVMSNKVINIDYSKPFEIPVYLNDNIELGAIGIKLRIENGELKILNIKSDIEGLIYNITDDGVNVAWAAFDDGYYVNPEKPLFYITTVYNIEPNVFNFQLPASSFQLSSESELADINTNIISTDKLFIPKIVVSTQYSVLNLSCYPNPFNSITNIEYTLPEDLNVKLSISNVLGEKVTTLVNTNQQAGQYTIKYEASNLRQGIYYCRIEATNSESTYFKAILMMIAK